MPDKWGRDFLRLMLEVDKHKEGFVDAYFGSPDIADTVKNSPLIPISELQTQLDELISSFDDPDSQRRVFVSGLLTSAKTILRLANNEPLTFHEEARLVFDIEPELFDEARFDEAQAQLETVLPGTGTLAERLQTYLRHYDMDGEQLDKAIKIALPETRKRTADFIDLVDGEGFVYSLVKDRVWGAYNWYQGDGQSLIEFNTDVPVSALRILDLCAHEGYPGHHTENMLKEKYLYQDKTRAEHAVVLLYASSAVIAEGIATTALEIIFPEDEAEHYLGDVLFPQISIDPHPADVRSAIAKARKAMSYVSYNAAIRHHSGELSEVETIQYIMKYSGTTKDRATRAFNFFTKSGSRSYVLTYNTGYDLIEKASAGDKAPLFRRLLLEPVMPSELRSMIAGN